MRNFHLKLSKTSTFLEKFFKGNKKNVLKVKDKFACLVLFDVPDKYSSRGPQDMLFAS